MARIYIETFGCQMNEADSQYIADRAASAGYSVAAKPEDANVLVLNTCTVREAAERRAYGRMGQFKVLKDADPNVRVVVTGCLAEQDRDRMQKVAPHVDAVFGTSELARLGDTLVSWRPSFVEDEASEERALIMPLGGSADCVTDAFSHLRAFVTVQRGCSYYCTFCIVPHVRGRFDHRPQTAIVGEARAAISAGAREVMLVGQTVNAWKDPASGADFAELCERVAAVPGLERLTFISPHPKDFSEEIIARLAGIPQLNPRVHLPLQSASDPVLRRMNRKYTFAQYCEKVDWILRHLPGWAITTDLIVGFPGETEDDFERTLEYVCSGIFANAYMFIYSRRRGTPAANWEQVPRHVASARFETLVQALNASARSYNDGKLGSIERCLITGTSKKDSAKLSAKTLDNVTVVAPKPPDYSAERYAQEPWLDIELESAQVWGCLGSVRGRAVRFGDAGQPVEGPVIDLIA